MRLSASLVSSLLFSAALSQNTLGFCSTASSLNSLEADQKACCPGRVDTSFLGSTCCLNADQFAGYKACCTGRGKSAARSGSPC
ncbi:hypothetical protein Cob_v006436 [Colletotrichum orbiculare MAFF 240422]|uniref:Uncharacterized protein n=1 Tax=Colletotrichum orbiculare (strain 104-T / ATCC 96160 / CBS 514.97 / LARS 414 / MAFF 240422) TaxID=1213857 RepID=A0A484FQB1_COLOR|nr:hypothetical protein Cob_v006436 [Colletotrichum orbiculare MAFF 240422]